MSHAIQILSRDASRTAPDRHLLAMMQRQVNQLVRLVDHLMELTRLNRGTFALQTGRSLHRVPRCSGGHYQQKPLLDRKVEAFVRLRLVSTIPTL